MATRVKAVVIAYAVPQAQRNAADEERELAQGGLAQARREAGKLLADARRAADEIVVLDRGKVAQRGSHDELAGVDGPYRDLWEAERLQTGYSGAVKVW